MSERTAKYNRFLFFRLPAAWWCGVRLKYLDNKESAVTVKHSWFNQNPFRSVFWAVLGMAAELSTGALVMEKIRASGYGISMLVANISANFSKKATGKIRFSCKDGHRITESLDATIATGEGQTFWMTSVGVDEEGITVATFIFEWTIKLRKRTAQAHP